MKPVTKSKKLATKKAAPKELKKVNNGIFTIDSTKNKKELREVVVYTILGSQDKLQNRLPVLLGPEADKQNIAYAKKNTVNDKSTYYVKVDNFGHLYNPITADRQTSLKTKLLKETLSKFIRVSEQCFNYYLEFLKTKNVLHLKFASQER
jgi:hypothetical protein